MGSIYDFTLEQFMYLLGQSIAIIFWVVLGIKMYQKRLYLRFFYMSYIGVLTCILIATALYIQILNSHGDLTGKLVILFPINYLVTFVIYKFLLRLENEQDVIYSLVKKLQKHEKICDNYILKMEGKKSIKLRDYINLMLCSGVLLLLLNCSGTRTAIKSIDVEKTRDKTEEVSSSKTSVQINKKEFTTEVKKVGKLNFSIKASQNQINSSQGLLNNCQPQIIYKDGQGNELSLPYSNQELNLSTESEFDSKIKKIEEENSKLTDENKNLRKDIDVYKKQKNSNTKN